MHSRIMSATAIPVILILTGCLMEPDDEAPEWAQSSAHLTTGVFVDTRDNQQYGWVEIDDQVWMSENLRYEPIDETYCPGSVAQNCQTHGRLYTWWVAMDSASTSSAIPSGVQGICPDGWHLPSDGEWQQLSQYIQSETGQGESAIAPHLKTTTGWGGESGNLDDFGFSGEAGGRGIFTPTLGGTQFFDRMGSWWSTTIDPSYPSYVLSREMWRGSTSLFRAHVYTNPEQQWQARSVRCLRYDVPQ